MAHEGGGSSILPILIVGGVGYYLYSSGILSSLFGTSAAAAPTTPPSTNPPAGGTNPVPATPPPPAAPATPPPACSPTNILGPLLAKVQKLPNGANYGPNLPGTFTIDEWGYYLNDMCSGMAQQYKLEADALFPGRDDRGGPLNWSAFSGYATQAGLSAVTPSRPAWSGRTPSALPPGLLRTLPAKARARGRRTAPRMIGTHPVRRVA